MASTHSIQRNADLQIPLCVKWLVRHVGPLPAQRAAVKKAGIHGMGFVAIECISPVPNTKLTIGDGLQIGFGT